MKGMISIVLVGLVTFASMSLTISQQKSEPQFKLVQFYMALLKKGPKWTADAHASAQLHEQHVSYVMSLLDSGKAIIAGPLSDEAEIRGVLIFRAPSVEEAKAWAHADPAVTSGHLIVEMHPWWSEDVMKKPASPTKFETTYLGFLTRGAKWTPEQTPATEVLQKAHMANIQRLTALKKLVVAGPFGDHGNLRGIFVFRVDSLEEAKTLAATDPAVQAG